MTERDAWVALPTEEEIRAQFPAGARHPYDFGFLGAMARLSRAHPRIGAAYGPLFRAIMFEPGSLSRREREMIAGVAAAAQDCHY
jgi:alkylhydroperoxidase/carboxymuconolactone decarboxylase family protein YurZ